MVKKIVTRTLLAQSKEANVRTRAVCVHETLKYTRVQLVFGVDSSSSTQSRSGEPATRAPAQTECWRFPGAAPDERGGAAAGAGGGADADRGREQDGLLRRDPRPTRQAQALPGPGDARRQEGEPGLLRHRREGGAVRRAIARGAGGGGKECGGGREGNRKKVSGGP
eukprot:scaffold115337_cov40-Phaeocystis_antarctica.AAC.1